MGQLDQVCKKAILKLSSRGWTAGRISDELREHYHVEISRQAISRFIAHYKVFPLSDKKGRLRKKIQDYARSSTHSGSKNASR